MGKDLPPEDDPVQRQRRQAELESKADQASKGNPHPQLGTPLRESEMTEADKKRPGADKGGVVP